MFAIFDFEMVSWAYVCAKTHQIVHPPPPAHEFIVINCTWIHLLKKKKEGRKGEREKEIKKRRSDKNGE